MLQEISRCSYELWFLYLNIVFWAPEKPDYFLFRRNWAAVRFYGWIIFASCPPFLNNPTPHPPCCFLPFFHLLLFPSVPPTFPMILFNWILQLSFSGICWYFNIELLFLDSWIILLISYVDQSLILVLSYSPAVPSLSHLCLPPFLCPLSLLHPPHVFPCLSQTPCVAAVL